MTDYIKSFRKIDQSPYIRVTFKH